MGMMRDFRTFLLRGNVVDLAVAVVIGAAFGAVLTSVVKDWITPLIALIVGKNSLAALKFSVNGVDFAYGDFLNALLSFLLIAAVVFFLIVTPVNAMIARATRLKAPAAPESKKCTECLSTIPIEAKRCAFCTSPQTAA